MAANTPPGPATDASGQSVVDPTKNVADLVKASERRLDDLAHQDRKALQRQLRTIRRELRLVRSYEKELRVKESARIDANRAGDVGAVSAAAEVQRNQQQALATEVTTRAEAARAAADAQQQQQQANLRNELAPLQAAVESLRAFQYENRGMTQQVQESKSDHQTGTENAGRWVAIGAAVFFGFGGLVLTSLNIAIGIYFATRK